MSEPFQVALNRPQRRAFAKIKPHRTVTLAFGRGVGKSHLLRVLWWMLVAQHDGRKLPGSARTGVRIIVFCPTLKQFKDIHANDILADLAGKWSWLGGKVDRTTWTIRFPGGSWIKPFPAAEHSSKRALGMRCDVICLDEQDDIDAHVFDTVAQPFLSEPCSLGIVVGAGTPRRGRHGLHFRQYHNGVLGERVRRGEDVGLDPDVCAELANCYSVFATYETVPETVSPRAVARAKATMAPATFAREWKHDFDAGEGLVYPFEETFHVRTPPPRESFREFLVGMDHGWVDPGVLVLIGIQGHGDDATAWILDEKYDSEVPNHVWNERAREWDFAHFWPDPSRPDRVADLRRMGLTVGNTDNHIHGGIARVADMMFRRPSEYGDDWARLYVAPKCVNTIRELGRYRRKKNPDGTFSEDPEDKDNHAPDAVRYALVGRFGRGDTARHVTSGR